MGVRAKVVRRERLDTCLKGCAELSPCPHPPRCRPQEGNAVQYLRDRAVLEQQERDPEGLQRLRGEAVVVGVTHIVSTSAHATEGRGICSRSRRTHQDAAG
jgi:hypothetical protein